MTDLFRNELSVINVGLSSFADAIAGAGAKVVNVDWRPPAGGDVATANALAHNCIG